MHIFVFAHIQLLCHTHLYFGTLIFQVLYRCPGHVVLLFFFVFCFQTTGRPIWKNTMTGEVTINPPKGMRKIAKMTEDMEKQKELLRAKRAKRR